MNPAASQVLQVGSDETDRLRRLAASQARLVSAVLDLSRAATIEDVQDTVRHAAREITGADGATFVLRDGENCHYVDEDAISPLWKGRRFPMATCISGWVMKNRRAVAIRDIYADARIPADAYRPTFVHSLVMVPIRADDPVGAIGNYWATDHEAAPEEMELLQALANTTAVALENVRIRAELEERVRVRTAELERANRELEAFSYSVSHDLRAPLRHISGYGELLVHRAGPALDTTSRRYLEQIGGATRRMGQLIDDLLEFSRVGRSELKVQRVEMADLVDEVRRSLQPETVDRKVCWDIGPLPAGMGDPALLRQVLANLLGNAVKYTRQRPEARITVTTMPAAEVDRAVLCVRDNGAGFDMRYSDKLFRVFSRLHGEEQFEGTGVGLATVQRILERHGQRIWAEAAPDRGAAFYFTFAIP
ncbi:MAG TPA: ATP-binding protein [Opitutaceae bacterium]|nr:ATP-binding protein [Opitutaceae bacterium]